jgi:hypothetical protein
MKVRRFIWSMAVMVAIALYAVPLPADIIHSNLGPGDSFDTSGGWNVSTLDSANHVDQDIAMPFTVIGTNHTFTSAELAMKLWLGGTPSLDILLTADAGGVPGAVIETMSVTVGNDPALVTATSVLNPTLVAGTTYWIATLAGGDHSSLWMLAGSPGGNNPMGTVGFSYDRGESWSTSIGEEAAFRVNGNVVPEPASLTLLGLGFLGLLGHGWRRKRAA